MSDTGTWPFADVEQISYQDLADELSYGDWKSRFKYWLAFRVGLPLLPYILIAVILLFVGANQDSWTRFFSLLSSAEFLFLGLIIAVYSFRDIQEVKARVPTNREADDVTNIKIIILFLGALSFAGYIFQASSVVLGGESTVPMLASLGITAMIAACGAFLASIRWALEAKLRKKARKAAGRA